MPTPREMMEAAQRREREEREGRSRSREPRQQAQRERYYASDWKLSGNSQRIEASSAADDGSEQRPMRNRQTQRASHARETQRRERTAEAQQSRSTRGSEARRQAQPQHASVPGVDDARAPEQASRARSKRFRDHVTRWRMFGVMAFGAIMVLGGVIGLLFFARPTTSAVEMRTLTAFPEFTAESFLDGSYFTQVSLWYADTYPLREPMVAADHGIDSLFGINTGTGMVGGNVQADEIPDDEGEEASKPVVVTPPAATPDEHAVAADIQENIMSGIYVQDGSGYAIYYFSKNAADTYIAAMNTAAEQLDGVSTVYSVMVPANSVTLSDEQQASVGGTDQQQTLDYLRTRFDNRVKTVELVDTIKQHRDEYLYFRTDHHWTQLGAYYAYVEFCKAKGIEPKSLSSWREVNLGEFQGTYYDTIEAMGDVAADDITAYVPSDTNEMTYWPSGGGDEVDSPIINEEAASWDPSLKYSAFIAGDQPLEIIHNPKKSDGSSCLVVKDSYGCAFVPELVDSYETIHVIDFRDTDKNLCDYARDNDIEDVIFLTGMKIGLTDSVAQMLLSEVSPAVPENVMGSTITKIRQKAHEGVVEG